MQKKNDQTPIIVDDAAPKPEAPECQVPSGSKITAQQPTIEVRIGQARIVIRGAVDQATLATVLKALKKQA